MKNKLKKGFTLVELVIVIAVIAILSAVLIPTFGNVISNANDSAAYSTASNALTKYTTNMAEANQATNLPNGYILVYNKDQGFSSSFDIYDSTNVPAYVFRFDGGAIKQKDSSDKKYVFETVCGTETQSLVVSLKCKYTYSNGKYTYDKEKGTAAISVSDSKATYAGAFVLDGVVGQSTVTGRVLLVADLDKGTNISSGGGTKTE